MSLKSKQQGFTIVELLIVIVVIGILALLVVTTFSGIQQKGRDTERQTDIKAIHSQLEAYYAQNGSYPETGSLDAAFVAAEMKGLDEDALSDPKNTAAGIADAAPAAGTYQYWYTATADGGGACTAAAGDCTAYTLTARLESGDDFVKTSLN